MGGPNSEVLKDVPSFKNMNEDEVMGERKKLTMEQLVEMDLKYNATCYDCLPLVAQRAQGCFVWDVNGKRYYDMLACYGAVSQGHCHPRILDAMRKQMEFCTLTSRAMYCDMLSLWTKYATEYLGYDRLLPANSGVEATETAIKLARRWGYDKKGIARYEAKIIVCEGNFHGRTTTIISASTDEDARGGYGPFTPGFIVIPFNDIPKLKEVLDKEGKNIAAFMVEPIQGEAGVNVPADGYLKKAKELCVQHNVLLVADEVQTGLGRTGKLMCCDHEGVRPDVLILGKALSGGVLPVSAVMADNSVMLAITRGTHGSTYGGNPLGCAAAIAALSVIKDEQLPQNAEKVGKVFRAEMMKIKERMPWIVEVRGKGLMNAIEISPAKVKAIDVCHELLKVGVIAKPTHDVSVRFTPPLIISENQMRDVLKLVFQVLEKVHAAS